VSGKADGTVAGKRGAFGSLRDAMVSWRTASVTLMSFASGMPLGLVWIAIPDWMRDSGIDIRVVGLITLAQAPWTFKFVWAPLMDRYVPPRLGRRRGWMALSQVVLLATTLGLAGLGDDPNTPWVLFALALAIAFAGATQDIAIDAYAVDVLRPEEQAVAVGSRNMLYRAGMQLAGSFSITLAGWWGWPAVNAMLAALYLPMLLVTFAAPEPADLAVAPRSMREAVWEPFIGFLSRHRALEILAFVFLYKFGDQLVQALQRPFLVDKGYSDFDRGFMLFWIGLVANIAGTFAGGLLTTPLGLGRALWLFGFVQIFSNVGYALVAHHEGINRPLMYGAFFFEALASGLGGGAFLVLLLRMTQKRFSATQYALFSSLFGLPRIISGPVCGFMVWAIGWEAFFWSTLAFGIPGMLMLARFVPWGMREPRFTVEAPHAGRPLTRSELTVRGVMGAAIGAFAGALVVAAMEALKVFKDAPEAGFDLVSPLAGLLLPRDVPGGLTLAGLLLFAAVSGIMTAAVVAARHGAARGSGEDGGDGPVAD
jgi:PAT family beta-lactamase induction signal transducer AmpG